MVFSARWHVLVQLLAATCFQILSAAGSLSSVEIVNATAFLSSADSEFNGGIEATAVGDKYGSMYATAFGPESKMKSAVGQFAGKGAQQLFYEDKTGASMFNGLRFLPLSPSLSKNYNARAIAADIAGHRAVQILKNKRTGETKSSVFCGDSRMVQPNDVAIAPMSGRVYLSGANFRNFNGTTIEGDGDLWLCQAPSGSFLKSSEEMLKKQVSATRLGVFGITNGIEVSPNEKSLYLSESFIKEGEGVKVNNILKFSIDLSTGKVYNKQLFIDLIAFDGLPFPAQNIVDGIRTDVLGNLFVVRIGFSDTEVLKISPKGKVLKRIKVPEISAPSNIDLGGPDGKSLFIVGTCADDATKGCVNVWRNSAPGRAFTNLRAAY
ncbi:hypothetical protein Mapa_003282 [Marchantia paleacea]|nr:hypothetical protein Mapa_003282 [Marchantia paleacea]